MIIKLALRFALSVKTFQNDQKNITLYFLELYFCVLSSRLAQPKRDFLRGLINEKSKKIGIETGGEYFGKTVGLFEKLLHLFVESLSMLRVTLVRENCLN